jgi:hypothetical protein
MTKMPAKKWTAEHRRKFNATMAAKRAGRGNVKRSAPVVMAPTAGETVLVLEGDRIQRYTIRTLKALVPAAQRG